MLLLWFSHVRILEMLDFMQDVKSAYRRLRGSWVDSRTSKLLPDLLDKVIEDSHFFKELSSIADKFSLEIESLVNSTSAAVDLGTSGNSENTAQSVRSLAEEIRGLSSQLRQEAHEIPDFLEHTLRFLELRRNLQESSGLWMLTVLASIFLPLSLACGILSMQTRLRDLHTLLYDFVGLVVLLLTLAGVFLMLIKVLTVVSEKLANRTRPSDRLQSITVKTLFVYELANLWALILTSFIVGMVKDVYLGVTILGYGIAVIAGLHVLLVAVIWVISSVI